ncbi:glycosyltransferase [Geomonas agri]|uniref:glycosyltransferase n=1 Tax=Geomonas agri TaxID=2873702 RepID=UPI001CD55A87|nr:glycosyltransferase [Geomonas agri]
MNILIITPELPFPSYRNGRTSTLAALIDVWRMHNNVTIIAGEPCSSSGLEYYKNLAVNIVENPTSKINFFFNVGFKVFIRPRNIWRHNYDLPEGLDLHCYDFILLVGFESALYLKPILEHRVSSKLVLFELDCLSLLYKKSACSTSNIILKLYYCIQYMLVERIERFSYSSVSSVFFVSNVDADYCISKFTEVKKRIFKFVNNGVNPVSSKWSLRSGDSYLRLCFSGNFDYLPNRLAAKFILTKIVPELSRRGITFTFHIVGANPGDDLLKMADQCGDSVIVTGFVEDIDLYLSDMDIYVSPLFLGTGMKNKILQAMNIGLPLVCSNVSLDGIKEMQDGYNCLVCNSSDEALWVNKIVELANGNNLCIAFSGRSQEVIEDNYRWERIAQSFIEKLLN